MILIACFFTSTKDIKITIRALYKHIFFKVPKCVKPLKTYLMFPFLFPKVH